MKVSKLLSLASIAFFKFRLNYWFILFLLTNTPPANLPQKDLRLQFKKLVNISDRFYDWLSKMTEPAAENRFNSAREALEILQPNKSIYKVIPAGNREQSKSLKIKKNHKFLQAKIVTNYSHFSVTLFLIVPFLILLSFIVISLIFIPFNFAMSMLGMAFLYGMSENHTLPRIALIIFGILSKLISFLIVYSLSIKINSYISKKGLFNSIVNFYQQNYCIEYKILNFTYAKYWFYNTEFKDFKIKKLNSNKTKIIIESKNEGNNMKLNTKLNMEQSQQLVNEVKDWLQI